LAVAKILARSYPVWVERLEHVPVRIIVIDDARYPCVAAAAGSGDKRSGRDVLAYVEVNPPSGVIHGRNHGAEPFFHRDASFRSIVAFS
jgi:hypothetical protein